jgi:hypothetical protein
VTISISSASSGESSRLAEESTDGRGTDHPAP